MLDMGQRVWYTILALITAIFARSAFWELQPVSPPVYTLRRTDELLMADSTPGDAGGVGRFAVQRPREAGQVEFSPQKGKENVP